MATFIHFLIQHNERIISISAGIIGLLSVVYIGWRLFGQKDPGQQEADATQLLNIEESLKKILSQTNAAIGTVNSQIPAGASVAIEGVASLSGQPLSNLEELKSELQARAAMIEDLQKKVETAKTADASTELLAKIKNLEGKLLEYEIIEDDIADLSHFKEENAKLKSELEALKRGGGAKLVDQFADELAKESGSAAPPPAEESIEDLLVETSLAESAAGSADAAEMPALTDDVDGSEALESAAAAEMGTEEAAAAEAQSDIFAEFSGAEKEEDPLAALGDIDADRMLDELKDLNAEFQAGAEALEEAPDMDKMAVEAVTLKKN